jgi:hypothetical protein
MMAAYALDAADHAAQLGYELDFSEKSLHDVETALGRLHNDLPRGIRKVFSRGPNQTTIEKIAKMYGGYIGEVLRFEWAKGEWTVPEDGPFAGALCLSYDAESLTSPPAKAFKRIVDGPADDIWFYYQILTQGLTESPQ